MGCSYHGDMVLMVESGDVLGCCGYYTGGYEGYGSSSHNCEGDGADSPSQQPEAEQSLLCTIKERIFHPAEALASRIAPLLF